jgi:hypothetical protein
MKALEVLESLVQKIFMLDRWRPKAGRSGKPGELVASLPSKDREVLQTLTSKEVETQLVPDPIYWCDDYYTVQDQDKAGREAKLNFNKTALKK